MSDELSPIARALLGGECDCDPPCTDRQVPCAICEKPTTCPAFIWHSVKLWNRNEGKLADVEAKTQPWRVANYIRPRDMGIACEGECTQRLYRMRHAEVQVEHATTRAYLGMLHAGKYNPESLRWLREHGCKRQVERLLAEEGNKNHG